MGIAGLTSWTTFDPMGIVALQVYSEMAMTVPPPPLDPALEALRLAWPRAFWEERLADAYDRLAMFKAVESAIACGFSEVAACERRGVDRSTHRDRRRRYKLTGFAGLFNKRLPLTPEPLKATPAVRDAICSMRLLDPEVKAERIAQVLALRFKTTVSTTVINRVCVEEKLSRSPAGEHEPPMRYAPEVTEMLFAGAEFFRLADGDLGYSAAMGEVIVATSRAVAAATPPSEPRPMATGRDALGHFTAESNAANAKGDSALGPAFRAIETKRAEVDLGARRLVTASPATVAGKVSALLALPYLTDTGRSLQVDTYRAQSGIAEACGRSYEGGTLDRFLRDMKYLGLGQPLVEAHARFWQANEPAADTKTAALCIYLDASNKALWTDKFTRCHPCRKPGAQQRGLLSEQ